MPSLKISNPKISLELVEELQDESAYQTEKAFTATHAFLRRVVYFSQNQEYASIPATKIKELFDNYDIKYKPCLDALDNHGIIVIDRQYIIGSKTRGYKLTEKGIRLMTEGELVYLRSLFSDAKLIRKIQKQASYHRTKEKPYKDDFLQYIHDGRLNYVYIKDAVDYIEQSNWSSLTKLDALMSLAEFMERDFTKLKYNDADKRVWNEFVGMKSDLRRYFALGNLKYTFVMDIRSCHPLFLAHYLVHRAKGRGWKGHHPLLPGDHQKTIVQNDLAELRSSFPNTTTTPTTTPTTSPSPIPSNPTTTPIPNNPMPHYVGGNSDILAELARWNALFSDPTTDPKAVLIRELGYTRETAKAALNQTINGNKQYKRFGRWFRTNFPFLHSVWARTDMATVGNEISAYYETELMQEMDLYLLADRLGLHLTYEYDGCGVMCREDDRKALAKIQQLIAHVQARSARLWGIRPVIVVKTAAGDAVAIGDIKPNRVTAATKPGPKPKAHWTPPTVRSGRSQSLPAPPVRRRRGPSA